MMKNLLSICFLSLLGLLVFSSCGKENNEVETSDQYVLYGLQSVQEQSSTGKQGCFELVYPINITFDDGISVEITDFENLRETSPPGKNLIPMRLKNQLLISQSKFSQKMEKC